jgi:TonB family protein
MKKSFIILLAAVGLILVNTGQAIPGPGSVVKLRVFEGVKEGSVPAQSVSSSFVLKSPKPNIAAEAALEVEQEQIKRAFNLKDVRLVSESSVPWDKGETPTARHMYRLDGKLYEVAVVSKNAASQSYQIEVHEFAEKESRSLLDTAFTVPGKNTAVFGFEDSLGKPYFISLREEVSGGSAGGVTGGAQSGANGGAEDGTASEKSIEEFAKGAVKVTDKIQPPKLITKVNPVYPEEARKAGLQGVVILSARTDIHGKVKDVMVLRSVPALNQAAIDAVKQWQYEPLIVDGQPKEAVFTTTVVFKLNGAKKEGAEPAAGTKDQVQPKLLTKVNPVYPEAARKAGIQGVVLVEAKIDEKGDVVAVKVVKSIPELDQAAIDAVKQWKYEPVLIEGKPVGVVFTVTIKFALQ